MREGKTVLKATIDNNELQLVKEESTSGYKYSLLWGVKGDKNPSTKPLINGAGKNMSTREAMYFFTKAIDSAKHMTFTKMTLEEILERTQEELL